MTSAAKSGAAPRRFRLRVGDEWFAVEVQDSGPSAVRVLVNDEPVDVEIETVAEEASAPSPGRPTHVENRDLNPPVYHVLENHLRLGVESGRAAQAAPAPAPPPPSAVGDPKRIVAPMPGRMISVAVKPGDQVAAGDEVCVMEAMKMQQSIRASAAGVVKEVHAETGQIVAVGAVLVELE